MKVRFLADYDFNGEIVDGILRREPSIDLKSGYQAGLEGIPDSEVLERALANIATRMIAELLDADGR